MNAALRDRTPERLRLEEALLQDFLDGLPEAATVTELSTLLAVSRTLILGRLHRGLLVGRKVHGHWTVDIDANMTWIASRRRTITSRRRLQDLAPLEATTVVVTDAEALRVLAEFACGGLSSADVVSRALRSYRPPAQVPAE